VKLDIVSSLNIYTSCFELRNETVKSGSNNGRGILIGLKVPLDEMDSL